MGQLKRIAKRFFTIVSGGTIYIHWFFNLNKYETTMWRHFL